jgi:predicted nucleic acid-binding protein
VLYPNDATLAGKQPWRVCERCNVHCPKVSDSTVTRQMSAKPFLDTNVIIYAFAKNDPRGRAAELLVAAGGTISVQVLNEFVNVSRRKLGRGWIDSEKQLKVLQSLLDPPVPLTLDLHKAAIEVARDHHVSFYDALIIAASAEAKCSVLYSEDMQDGRQIEGITIKNPFAGS